METYHCETTEHKHKVKLFKTMQEIGWKRQIKKKQTSQKQKLKGDRMLSSNYWGNMTVNQEFYTQLICKSSEINTERVNNWKTHSEGATKRCTSGRGKLKPEQSEKRHQWAKKLVIYRKNPNILIFFL